MYSDTGGYFLQNEHGKKVENLLVDDESVRTEIKLPDSLDKERQFTIITNKTIKFNVELLCVN